MKLKVNKYPDTKTNFSITPFSLPDSNLLDALSGWKLSKPIILEKLSGGYTADVWLIQAENKKYIAKFAYDNQEPFDKGLLAAEILNQHGIVSSFPIRTRDGKVSKLTEGPPKKFHPLAVLEYLEGKGLNLKSSIAQTLFGKTLGQIHAILMNEQGLLKSQNNIFTYLSDNKEEVFYYPWLGKLIQNTISEIRSFEEKNLVTYGVIYGDGMEFLYNKKTEKVEVIDLGSVGYGPLLFDLALAWNLFKETRVHDLHELTESYLTISPMKRTEIKGLQYYIKLAWVRQAKWFAWRVIHNVIFGDKNDQNNKNGLEKMKKKLLGSNLIIV